MRADFRQVLREETQADHARVDRLLSFFDIARPDGLEGFLLVHKYCFREMQGLAAPDSHAAASLQKMIEGIERDLETLGVRSSLTSSTRAANADLLAIDYMIEGSRLGSKVLKRKWSGSSDPVVQRADSYFSIDPVPGRWREVCAALSDIPADSRRARQIIADTRQLFGMFFDVASGIKNSSGQQQEKVIS